MKELTDTETIEAYIMEGAEGKYLHINCTEDGNGTWWDWTESPWEAYWMTDLSRLRDIAETEFSDFGADYPKFHKMRFTREYIETEGL